MKIVHLAAGAGGMYCGSCLHTNTLAAALLDAGEDVLLVPLYTPIRTDEHSVSIDRLAFGGVNVYLQQRWRLFRHTPRLIDRLLDHPRLLRWVTRRGSRTRPEELGDLTVSMLRGEEGRQRKEVDKLVEWLRNDVRPDLIHLSNVMLAGLARQLNRQLDVPVIATLSGEDLFLEQLPKPQYEQARSVLRQRAADLAAMIAMNGYYADFMAEYLDVPRQRIHVIPAGLKLDGHRRPEEQPADRAKTESLTIGYFARICPEKGLHVLAEAFILLASDPKLPPLRLAAGGYLGEADRPYFEQIKSRLHEQGLADRFQFHDELDREAKIALLQSFDLFSVPTVYAESKGLSILEAWANGVPAVLPEHGVFPELIEETGGGLLCRPADPASLAAALKRLIEDPALAARCGHQAHLAVHQRYNASLMADRVGRLYREVAGGD